MRRLHFTLHYKLKTMTSKILEKLKEVEKNRGIEILLAVESGSRAWVLLHQTAIMTYVLSTDTKKTGIFRLGIRMKQ